MPNLLTEDVVDFYRNITVLVTGGSGFIGSRLVRALAPYAKNIRILTRFRGKTSSLFDQYNIEFFSGDLAYPETLRGLCKDVNIIFHLAGVAHVDVESSSFKEGLHYKTSVIGTKTLLADALDCKVGRIIYVSSVKAAAEETGGCIDETYLPHPTTDYGKSRQYAEQLLLDAANKNAISSTVVRLPLVYGTGVRGNLNTMIDRIYRKRFPPLPKSTSIRSMVSADDVVRVLIFAAANNKTRNNTYYITDGQSYTAYRIYNSIRQALGMGPAIIQIPKWIFLLLAKFLDLVGKILNIRFPFGYYQYRKLFSSACFLSSRIYQELGLSPLHTFEQQLPEIIVEYFNKSR
jgi:UDP-glucose 4-epimerase